MFKKFFTALSAIIRQLSAILIRFWRKLHEAWKTDYWKLTVLCWGIRLRDAVVTSWRISERKKKAQGMVELNNNHISCMATFYSTAGTIALGRREQSLLEFSPILSGELSPRLCGCICKREVRKVMTQDTQRMRLWNSVSGSLLLCPSTHDRSKRKRGC